MLFLVTGQDILVSANQNGTFFVEFLNSLWIFTVGIPCGLNCTEHFCFGFCCITLIRQDVLDLLALHGELPCCFDCVVLTVVVPLPYCILFIQ